MAIVKIEINETDLRALVIKHLEDKLNVDLKPKDVKIETKSRQNYRSEWESGAGFRATVEKNV